MSGQLQQKDSGPQSSQIEALPYLSSELILAVIGDPRHFAIDVSLLMPARPSTVLRSPHG